MAVIIASPTRAGPTVRSATPQVAEWRTRLEALPPDSAPCPGYRPRQWLKAREFALRFLDEYGDAAARLGWTTSALFDVHPVLGITCRDACGGLVSSERPVTAITQHALSRDWLTFFRPPDRRTGVPVWAYQWAG